ncbi:Cbb3-type cytochrome c oxidase subunit CcoP [Kordia antarctica]|uniref:Cbb3-type cytochrome c oxidase subunit CcoP n=1 Tax=Kordia antarctica TaxID=1218801 RepID=A0A7L4ZMG1_9FLAO|nr:cbb3-type cytochrome c oxidase N-terminal domain-containing protein [Kordia antarctica]QHI37832.1 Cbb3-type cytochrome c oxidase subunit CcoP [Kordia antarctica]
MRNLIPSWVRVLVIFFLLFIGVEYFVESGDRPAFIEEPLILLFLLLVVFILIAIEGIIAAMENILFNGLDEAAKATYLEKKNKVPEYKLVNWFKKTYKKSVGTKPIEAEAEIILDHNYDGIRELDNDLPPWWKYGFYASIVFAGIYLAKYHVFNGDGQYVELEEEYAEAKVAYEEYLKTAKDLIDYKSVVLLTEASDVSAGKTIYAENCVACHAVDGGGGIGPNLTDKHWVLGGGINNVFKTISKGGRSGKGMEAWSKKGLKPSEIAQVSSFILSFEGTTPAAPKDAEGDIWEDPTKVPENAKVIDSTKVEVNE